MSETEYGLVTIGNALVDVLAHTTEEYIASQKTSNGMEKGSMNLIDSSRAIQLFQHMDNPQKMSGGSAGNTMACYASFGGKGGYIGKVADDELGASFASSLKDMGVHYDTKPLQGKEALTGHCMILVTPDGERTMNTFLGAAVELKPEDIDVDLVKAAQVTYLEGYLYDPPQAMEAFIFAARTAHEAGRKVSFTLSDPFCVDRHRNAFKDLIDGHIDILFANEEEIKSLFETEDLEDAIAQVKDKCSIVCITRSEKGSVILKDGERFAIDAEPVEKVVDTTGAGDAYAAGFLFGYTEGKDMKTCGRYASIAAAEVISHMGPRPSVPLKTLLPSQEAA